MISRLANPARFMRLSGKVLPWLGVSVVVALVAGLLLALLSVIPEGEAQGQAQRDTARIMFVHVPAAWLAMQTYFFIAVASGVALVWRHALAEIAAQAAAPIGAAFTLVCLITGSLWGQPVWNTWWAWDVRLTAVLMLFFLYLGYIALVNAFDDPTRGARAGSLLAVVGVVILPIIKFSVERWWWRFFDSGTSGDLLMAKTLHQPASIGLSGSTLPSSMLTALLVMTAGFTLLFAWLLLLRMRTMLNERKARALRLGQPEPRARDAIPEASAVLR
jgi:heme exporter protein C